MNEEIRKALIRLYLIRGAYLNDRARPETLILFIKEHGQIWKEQNQLLWNCYSNNVNVSEKDRELWETIEEANNKLNFWDDYVA